MQRVYRWQVHAHTSDTDRSTRLANALETKGVVWMCDKFVGCAACGSREADLSLSGCRPQVHTAMTRAP